ncbi:Acyl-CoA-binding domain-containing protein 6 [Linum perenne]
MFSFSKKRTKLGRVKKVVQLSESISTPGARSPIRPPKRAPIPTHSDDGRGAPTTRHCDDELDCYHQASSSENWMVLSTAGDKPAPRFNHSATVIGNKMIVVGGESSGGLLDDVQVSWGKKALLIGGKTDPHSDRISVWAFDTETECWSLMEAKGDIPIARSGHTVVRSSSTLILFGGEDSKKKKLNDLHMFDLKSLTWLPLHFTGTGPSARSNHVSTLFDDKMLLIFGGASKSRTLNDLYSLDFESMVWSRIKIRGFHPSPRAGSCGVLCGTKWYIAGGGSRKKRHSETLIFDVLKVEWSVAFASQSCSITTNKGFSLVLVQHKEKDFLVAFGGSRKEPSNQVEVMGLDKHESLMGRRSAPGSSALEKHSSFTSHGVSQRSVDYVVRQNLASAIEYHGSGRKSLSESSLLDPGCASGNVSLRKQFHEEEHNRTVKTLRSSDEGNLSATDNQLGKIIREDNSCVYSSECLNSHKQQASSDHMVDKERVVVPENDFPPGGPHSSVYQLYEAKIAALIKKNGVLEGQVAAALAGQEAAEKNFSAAMKSKQELEKRLVDTAREFELLKEKLTSLELAHEEANNMSNVVHSDNVRLEHDVAFLKAVFDDTQKELHSTRGVLAGERARAFQLQVEVFHFKQRLQSLENRASTPRKPYHV